MASSAWGDGTKGGDGSAPADGVGPDGMGSISAPPRRRRRGGATATGIDAPERGSMAAGRLTGNGTSVAKRAPAHATVEAADVTLGYLGDFIGFHLRLAQDASYRVFARHREKDLIKPGRFPALAIIHQNPGLSQSALGRAIARDKSTISPLIKDLQKNGLISRKPSVQDRRSVTLALTRKGERTLAKLHVRAAEHEGELDRLIGPSKARLMALLDKIVAGMAAQAPG